MRDRLVAMFPPVARSLPLPDLARWADEWTPRQTSGAPGVDGWLTAGDDVGATWARRRGFLLRKDPGE